MRFTRCSIAVDMSLGESFVFPSDHSKNILFQFVQIKLVLDLVLNRCFYSQRVYETKKPFRKRISFVLHLNLRHHLFVKSYAVLKAGSCNPRNVQTGSDAAWTSSVDDHGQLFNSYNAVECS